MSKLLVIACVLGLSLSACQEEKEAPEAGTVHEIDDPHVNEHLPYIGEHFYEGGDTIYHQILPFGLTNQYGDTITHRTVAGKIYLADFFFTKCAGQCPKMTAALKRVQQNCKDVDFVILSHSIDPARDTAETFLAYIEKYGLDDSNWHFLTGDKQYIRNLGEESYIAVSGISPDGETMGDVHSPHIYLIDGNRHIRGFYDGTDAKDVDRLMVDLRLLAEEE